MKTLKNLMAKSVAVVGAGLVVGGVVFVGSGSIVVAAVAFVVVGYYAAQ